MHETSLALGMVDEVMRIAREHDARKVVHVFLRIGKMSGIVVDSLLFAFEAIRQEYPLLASAELTVDEVPSQFLCKGCGKTFTTDAVPFPACPRCNQYDLNLLAGNEQLIERVELEV